MADLIDRDALKDTLCRACSNGVIDCGAKMDADHIADDSKKVGGDDNG